jgi:hypothetical protein
MNSYRRVIGMASAFLCLALAGAALVQRAHAQTAMASGHLKTLQMTPDRKNVKAVGIISPLAAFGQLAQEQPKDGAACEVTSGPNKGKKGVYTDGGTWCEGSWGGTECTGADGTSKCTAAAVSQPPIGGVRVPVSVLTAGERQMWQEYVVAIQPGAAAAAVQAWTTKYKARIVSRTASEVTVALSGKTVIFDGRGAQKKWR